MSRMQTFHRATSARCATTGAHFADRPLTSRGTRVSLFVLLLLVLALTALANAQPGAGAPTGTNPANPASPTGEPEARQTIDAISIQEIARLEGQGEVILRGVGIVTGLKGTGDSGQDLALARPLAKIYESNGNPMGDLRELAKAKSAALVFVTVTIPAQGARVQDKLDAHITVSHSATSLAGGRLFLSPLSGPLPGQGVFAIAEGALLVEDTNNPTVAVIRGGAQVTHDILMPIGSDRFRLVVHPHLRSFTVTERLAATINARFQDPAIFAEGADAAATPPAIARAIDDIVVEVTVPPESRREPAGFVADCLTASMDPAELRLPAKVVVNQRTGTIIVTGNVEISPVAVAHKDLVVTTTQPLPGQPATAPTPATPRNSRWTSTSTTSRASERARIQDLLQAFKQLDVPVADQINILTQMHRSGRLHAQLVIE
ncbi:MAG: flagellar basal body P-ring protein FlgI [Phycisphaerales bacterium]|nr:flagellar basal body P-ring protein FlgI [Phycisphaerales bacterium]